MIQEIYMHPFKLHRAVKRNGYKSGKLNSDGSAEITMDKSMYESKIKELESTLRNLLKEAAEDDELPNVDSAEADSDFKTVTVYVKSEPGLMDYMSSLAFAAPMATYHIFKGDSMEGLKIKYVDVNTGELYGTQDTTAVLKGETLE